MKEDETKDEVKKFEALSNPTRYAILRSLHVDKGMNVEWISETIGVRSSVASTHLNKLLDAGLVDRQEVGRYAYYSLRPDGLWTVAKSIEGLVTTEDGSIWGQDDNEV